MFKPLLETIPSLSGNMKISCFLEGYDQISNNIYNCFVQYAKLSPISHELFDSNIELNLKNNSFEYDVKDYFAKYSDTFYKTKFSYSKVNIPILDKTIVVYDNAKDFQFGCKRISYKKSKNTFAFFAPIYVECLEDIVNKKFRIKCELHKLSRITKYIDIHISNVGRLNNKNYLGDYLDRYCSKINSDMIFCSTSYQNIYYGIDCVNGGFVKIEDNLSSNIYKKYYTINDFDCILNNGFKRNSIMAKQILNLSFIFDLDNILGKNEKETYKNAKVTISGKWIDGNNECAFYDFSNNYSYLHQNVSMVIGKDMKESNVYSNVNIMNTKYPGLNESTSENFKYINTVAKNYNRWKLKYSSDSYPYITNLNYGFSINQNSIYAYREFPYNYSTINAICKPQGDFVYNLIYGWNYIYNNKGDVINNNSAYNNLFNQKHIASFFEVITKENNSNKYIDIFSTNYGNLWGNVDLNDNKVYYKGILYNLNYLYKNLNEDLGITKFGVFVHPIFNNDEIQCVKSSNYNTIYKKAKYCLTKKIDLNNSNYQFEKFVNDSNENKYYNYQEIIGQLIEDDTNDTTSNENNVKFIKNDQIVKLDDNGEYFAMNNQYDYDNIYYDVNDILIVYEKYYINSGQHPFNDNSIQDLRYTLFNYAKDKLVNGYKVLDIAYVSNILNNNFDKIFDLYSDLIGKDNIPQTFEKILFRENFYSSSDRINALKDKLYFSIYPSNCKYKLTEKYDLIQNTESKYITLYYQTYFIPKHYIFKLNELMSGIFNWINEDILSSMNAYYYANGLYNAEDDIVYTNQVFIELSDIENNYGDIYNNDKNIIYVDPYNMQAVYNQYLHKNYNPNNMQVEEFYCKFLNLEHIIWYFKEINKDWQANTIDDPINTIFIKIKYFNLINYDNGSIDYNTARIYDSYIPLNSFGIENVGQIIQYINYDQTSESFYFLNTFFTNYISQLNDDTILALIKELKIYSFDIVFKKNMIKMNTDLYNLINSPNKNDVYKDLYLYRLCNKFDFKTNLNYVVNDILNNRNLNGNLNQLLTSINNDTHKCLIPYFNDIYDEDKTQTKIYSDVFLGNIVKCENDTYTYYRYNTPNIDFLFKITDNQTNIESKYSLVQMNKNLDSFVSSTEFFTNMIDRSYLDKLKVYPIESNLFTYEYNGEKYGFYIVNSYFDNTKHTLKIQNTNFENITCVDYIDGIYVDDINKYQTSYLGNIYKNLLPYIKTSNIVQTICGNINAIVKPSIYKLENNYIQYPNFVDDKLLSYTIYYTNNDKNIELHRYFDNIVPLIDQRNSKITYNLYFKENEKNIEKYFEDTHQNYIMYQANSSLEKYDGISYFDVDYKLHKYMPTEHKYFNNNVFYNLEKEIICDITSNDHMSYEEMVALENNSEYIYNVFKKYIINNITNNGIKENTLSENDILFLYKKYDIKFLHTQKYDNEKILTSNNEFVYKNKYSIKIKFSLL